MSYELYFTRQAVADWEILKQQGNSNLLANTRSVLDLLRANPMALHPPFKKLGGELNGLFARRLDTHHRLIYQVTEERKAVKILSMCHWREG